MNDTQELYDMLDGLKQKIEDNLTPDGKCLFDAARVKMMLQLTDTILQDSITSHAME